MQIKFRSNKTQAQALLFCFNFVFFLLKSNFCSLIHNFLRNCIDAHAHAHAHRPKYSGAYYVSDVKHLFNGLKIYAKLISEQFPSVWESDDKMVFKVHHRMRFQLRPYWIWKANGNLVGFHAVKMRNYFEPSI